MSKATDHLKPKKSIIVLCYFLTLYSDTQFWSRLWISPNAQWRFLRFHD